MTENIFIKRAQASMLALANTTTPEPPETKDQTKPSRRSSRAQSSRSISDAEPILIATSEAAADHLSRETQYERVSGTSSRLLLAASSVDDIEDLRKRTENRIRALKSEDPNLDLIHYEKQLEAFKSLEEAAIKQLQKEMREHPLGPWVKRTIGIGEKQGARLIAAIGSIYYNHAADRPRRGPAELWTYCGYAPGQKRKKGQQSNWNAQAKMRAFLCAESCIKQARSPYRSIYDSGRASWIDRDTSDMHKHNHALRRVAKEILKDLFLEAQRLEV
jgi:hypothetical protein